jgi:hypothetical protein
MLPKKGKKLHRASRDLGRMVAVALKSELGTTHQAVKTVMRWTGASERTVKHWFAGTHGPSGQHLVALASHSDAVFTRFLQAANRHSSLVGLELVSIRSKALELVEIIDGIGTFDALIKRET